MTRDEIIQMAKQAGFTRINPDSPVVCGFALFERFAALVAAAERERCAKTCDGVAAFPSLGAKDCANIIRAMESP